MIVALSSFWLAFGLLAWTHLLYPVAVRLVASLRTRHAVGDRRLPAVAIIIAAHNEESVIERRIANLCGLEYPSDNLQIIVTSDASTDRTEELAASAGAHVITNPRGGKVSAQDRAVRECTTEIVAFSDANATWAPD